MMAVKQNVSDFAKTNEFQARISFAFIEESLSIMYLSFLDCKYLQKECRGNVMKVLHKLISLVHIRSLFIIIVCIQTILYLALGRLYTVMSKLSFSVLSRLKPCGGFH